MRHANGGFEARLRGSCMRYTIRTKSLHLPYLLPENARISIHDGLKKGSVCGANRRPFLLSLLPSLAGPFMRALYDGAGAIRAGGNGWVAGDAWNAE